MILRPLVATATFLAFVVSTPVSAQQPASASGSGEDILSDHRRLDLRAEVSSAGKADELRFTLRADHQVELRHGWRLNLRIDAPFAFTNDSDYSGAPHEGSDRGDVLLHVALVRRLPSSEGFGFGTQLIIPTAGKQSLGTGKWRLRPGIAYRWPIASISDSSFFQLLARYDFSFAGDAERSDVRQLQISPNLEIGLSGDAYLSFFPSADIRYNFVQHEWFVPVDVELGKKWGRLVLSLEGAAGVIKGAHAPYDWRTEARIGLQF